MTSTTSPSSSSPQQLTICSLPDLPLLVVFDHLPLLDLFNRIPLVCPRWTHLQSGALKRRTRFHLKYTASNDPHVHPLDRLPLPSTYHGWTTGTGGRLLRSEAVEWLWARLPNITELTLVVLDPNEGLGYSYQSRRVREAITEQAIRLVTAAAGQQQWCPRLTSLHLDLSPIYRFRVGGVDLGDDLITSINHRMPALTELYLGKLPHSHGPSVLLSGATLARLRRLEHTQHSEWLWKSLWSYSSVAVVQGRWSEDETTNLQPPPPPPPLRPDLQIAAVSNYQSPCLIRTSYRHRALATVYGRHFRGLALNCYRLEDLSLALHRIPNQFQALSTLKLYGLTTEDQDEEDIDGYYACRLVATVLRRLSPLTSLGRLYLYEFDLSPPRPTLVEAAATQLEMDDEPEKFVLPSLELLELLYLRRIASHSDLARGMLDWPRSLPRLRLLAITGEWNLQQACQPCATSNGGDLVADDDDGSTIPYGFFANDECRRATFAPLEACAELAKIELEYYPDDGTQDYDGRSDDHDHQAYTATRTTDLTGSPFQWAKTVPRQ